MNSTIISLLVLFICIVLFITRKVPASVTACLGCLLFVLAGVCEVKEAFSGFSNPIVILVFGMMIVGIAVQDTGVAKIISQLVMKVAKRNERLFIFVAGLTSAVLSTFLSNTAVIAIFLPIIESVAKSDKKMNRLNITLPVTLGAMFGGVCTLVGSTPQLTANGILLKMSNMELKMFDFFRPGIAILIVYLIYVLTIGHRIGNRVWGSRSINEKSINSNESINVNKSKVIFMILIFTFMIVSFIGNWISTEVTAIIAAILCIVFGCTNTKSISKKMDWSVVFVLAGFLGIASGIAKGGVGDLIGKVFSSVLSNSIPPLLIFSIFVILTMVISNFINNSTTVIIMLPIAISLCDVSGMNPIAYTLGIVFAANLAFSTPLANAQTAMTLVADYKFTDYIRYTWLLDILVILSIIIFVPLFYPLV